MNKRRQEEESIDWSAVLGPVLSRSPTSQSTALHADELVELQQATFAHVRRAVRPRPELAASQLPFPSQAVPWFSQGRFLEETPAAPAVRPGGFVQYAAGDYYIQDAGSMLALAACDVQPGQWVCDTCAAPGGKSTGLLEQLGGSGVLVANEVIRSRLSLLSAALQRTGLGNQLVTNLEIEQLSQLCGPVFDCVLVDAPCTGQTMVARGKQSMAAFSAAQIAHSSARQQRILRAAAGLVKLGGRLVYSTCAYSYAENESMVLEFVGAQAGWRLSAQPGLEAWSSPLAEGCYRVWPHRHGCSGAFAAVLTKHAEESVAVADLAPPKMRAGYDWQALEHLPAELEGVLPVESGAWWLGGDQLHRFDPCLPVEWIRAGLAGTELARRASEARVERWTPSFGAAMWGGAARRSIGEGTTSPQLPLSAAPRVELDDGQAIRYVAGESLRDVERGAIDGRAGEGESCWCVVCWRGRPLGWGKLTQGTLKNHFPKMFRQPNSSC